MKIANRHRNLKIIVEDEFINKLSDLGVKQFPKEFGGFLIGYYSDDFKSLHVTDTILPKVYSGSSHLFNRSGLGLESILKNLYNQNPKKYYIGEWHTHPNGSIMYSQTDLQAMIEIEKCETVRIKNPILLIVSINKTKMNDFNFYLYDNKKLLEYEK